MFIIFVEEEEEDEEDVISREAGISWLIKMSARGGREINLI